jgi:hypothetical protein
LLARFDNTFRTVHRYLAYKEEPICSDVTKFIINALYDFKAYLEFASHIYKKFQENRTFQLLERIDKIILACESQ